METWKAQRCPGCGGMLPVAGADVATVTCSFCGLACERPRLERPADLEPTNARVASRGWQALERGMAISTAIVMLAIGVYAFRFVRKLDEIDEQGREAIAQMSSLIADVHVDDLAKMASKEPHAVVLDAPVGGYERVDPVGQLAWAEAVARRWADDAALERIEGGPFAADGTVNLSGSVEASLTYWFVSPGRIALWSREADQAKTVDVDYEIQLEIKSGRVTATVVRGQPAFIYAPPSAQWLSLGDALARARQYGFPERPFYLGSLSHNSAAGWQWSLNAPSGVDRPKMLDAATGKPEL